MKNVKSKVMFLIDGVLIETLDTDKVNLDQIVFIRAGLASQYGSELENVDVRYLTIIEKIEEPKNAIHFLKAVLFNRLSFGYNLN